MNGLGLAGVELHGMIGYNILARYRMDIDFTKDKMVWTPLELQAGRARSASAAAAPPAAWKSWGR